VARILIAEDDPLIASTLEKGLNAHGYTTLIADDGEKALASIVQNMYSSGSNNGFLIRDATEGQDAEQQFYAREKGESPPQLVLAFKPAP
jgi:CheY-like chemotaxis protein